MLYGVHKHFALFSLEDSLESYCRYQQNGVNHPVPKYSVEDHQLLTTDTRTSYTHYYEVLNWDSPEWKKAWPQLIKDVPTIIQTADIPLQGPDERIADTTPSSEEDDEGLRPPPPPIVKLDEGIDLNGIEKKGHEPLIINPRKQEWSFVKTARKPYDIVVACVLLRAFMLAPGQFKLSSDGFWHYEDEWGVVRELYRKIWPGEEISCPWGDNNAGQEPEGNS